MAEVGSAYVTVLPSARGFGSKLNSQVGGDVEKSGKTVGKRFGGAIKLGAAALVGGVVGGFLKSSLGEAREAQKVGAQTTAVIKSTGGAANVTAGQVGRLATSLSKKVGIDDEVIQSGQNMLLTFKNVRNEAGKGNKIFNQATRTLVDMSVAMGEDPKQAAIKFGKALNDPIKGITALSRVGVTFSDKQKAVIKKMVETGNTLGAQKIILKELNSEFGGSAKAQATAGDKARVAWQNLQETIGTALLPVVDKAATFFTNKAAPAISKFVGEMQDGTGAGGRLVDGLQQIVSVGKNVIGFFTSLPGPVKKFALEGLVAYAAISKLNSVVGGLKLTGFISQLASSETRMDAVGRAGYRMGGILRTAAGAGGLLLLSDGMHQSSKAAGTLETTLGGAAAGFAVGGPIGAAIGGLGGLFLGLSNDTDAARVSASKYAGTLDQLTGKITAMTRQKALDALTKDRESSGYELATQLGIPDKQLVDAATGNANAFIDIHNKLMLAVIRGNINEKQAGVLENFLKKQRGELGLTQQQLLHNIAVNRTYSKAINTLPKAVQTDIKTNGLEPTRKAIVDLTAKYHLTPKSIRTLIKENGGRPTKAMVDSIITSAKNLGKQHPKVKVSAETAQARDSILNVKKMIDGLHNKTVTLTVNTNNDLAKPNGRRATGGPVSGGKTYLVGERGPELFTASQSGRITPNNKLAAGGGAGIGGDGAGVLHLYDHDGILMGSMTAVADERYYANGALASQ